MLFQSRHSEKENVTSGASLEQVSAKLELGKACTIPIAPLVMVITYRVNPNGKLLWMKMGIIMHPPLNGTGHTWHHSEEQLYNIIRYGLKFYNENYDGKMQGNDKLSDEDVWSILEYIKSVLA